MSNLLARIVSGFVKSRRRKRRLRRPSNCLEQHNFFGGRKDENGRIYCRNGCGCWIKPSGRLNVSTGGPSWEAPCPGGLAQARKAQ